MKMKKILCVSQQYRGYRPENGVSHEAGFYYSFKRLAEQRNMVVDVLFTDKYLLENRVSDIHRDLDDLISRTVPDFIFFAFLPENKFDPSYLMRLKERYVTMGWFNDEQWRFERFVARYARCFSLCFTSDKYSIPKYRAIGVTNVYPVQSGTRFCLPREVINQPSYKYDVSFVGSLFPYRYWIVTELRKRGINVVTFGAKWPESRPLPEAEMMETFLRSKINLNMSKFTSRDFRFILSSWRSIRYVAQGQSPLGVIKSSLAFMTPRERHRDIITARIFEIPACGGFLLTDYVTGLEDYYSIGSEVGVFADLGSLLAQINYYLENDVEREAIRIRGYECAISKHTYDHRVESILRYIGDSNLCS